MFMWESTDRNTLNSEKIHQAKNCQNMCAMNGFIYFIQPRQKLQII